MFQGVLGDFFKDQGISTRQEHLMTKAYVQAHSSSDAAVTMWIRMGTVEGVRYLARHFQIVLFSRDVKFEDFGSNVEQVNLIANYFR